MNNYDRNFIYAAFFFLSAAGFFLSSYFLQLNLSHNAILFWNRFMFAMTFTFFYTFPHFVYSLFDRKFARTFSLIIGITALALVILTFFTNLLITERIINFNGVLRPAKTELLYIVLFAELIFSVYIFFEAPKKNVKINRENLVNTKPMIVGSILAFALGAIDITGTLLNKPLLFNIHDPLVFGLFAIIVTYAWSFLSQYSLIFTSLNKSKEEIEKLVMKQKKNVVEFVQLIAKTLDAKDEYTAGHSLRVSDYAVKIAQELNLSEQDIEILRQACLLHDIGKIGIPDGILNKKGPLNNKEKRYIENHPILGKKILSNVSEFQPILDIVYAHHERVDGKGYPNGLIKDKIPLLARIIAVADTFDAMTSKRPYREAKTKEEAIREIISIKDKQLDGEIVDVFLRIANEG
ncbi:MAG: HD-GYP domain-containing protein [bacterium]